MLGVSLAHKTIPSGACRSGAARGAPARSEADRGTDTAARGAHNRAPGSRPGRAVAIEAEARGRRAVVRGEGELLGGRRDAPTVRPRSGRAGSQLLSEDLDRFEGLAGRLRVPLLRIDDRTIGKNRGRERVVHHGTRPEVDDVVFESERMVDPPQGGALTAEGLRGSTNPSGKFEDEGEHRKAGRREVGVWSGEEGG